MIADCETRLSRADDDHLNAFRSRLNRLGLLLGGTRAVGPLPIHSHLETGTRAVVIANPYTWRFRGHEIAGVGVGGTASGAVPVGGSLPPMSSRKGG